MNGIIHIALQEQLHQLLSSFLDMLSNPIMLTITIVFLANFIFQKIKWAKKKIRLAKENKKYAESSYYQITKKPLDLVKKDISCYGEYLTYIRLKKFESLGAKFLFNVYIPKENGETSEIDVLMISSKGIFVFESKNYSGWIFGNENQINWYQTLPLRYGKSHKEHFYNPIMQNKSHIKHLKNFLNTEIPAISVIVFSDRCTLKKVKISNNDIKVINLRDIDTVVSAIYDNTSTDLLNENEIELLYNKLYPCTQLDDFKKAEHIANIRKNINTKSVQQATTAPVLETHELSTETSCDKNVQADNFSAKPVYISDPATEISATHIDTELINNDSIQEISKIMTCPKCNSNLILRTANRGANVGKQFYGCSNFPKCRYIQNIK